MLHQNSELSFFAWQGLKLVSLSVLGWWKKQRDGGMWWLEQGEAVVSILFRVLPPAGCTILTDSVGLMPKGQLWMLQMFCWKKGFLLSFASVMHYSLPQFSSVVPRDYTSSCPLKKITWAEICTPGRSFLSFQAWQEWELGKAFAHCGICAPA